MCLVYLAHEKTDRIDCIDVELANWHVSIVELMSLVNESLYITGHKQEKCVMVYISDFILKKKYTYSYYHQKRNG